MIYLDRRERLSVGIPLLTLATLTLQRSNAPLPLPHPPSPLHPFYRVYQVYQSLVPLICFYVSGCTKAVPRVYQAVPCQVFNLSSRSPPVPSDSNVPLPGSHRAARRFLSPPAGAILSVTSVTSVTTRMNIGPSCARKRHEASRSVTFVTFLGEASDGGLEWWGGGER